MRVRVRARASTTASLSCLLASVIISARPLSVALLAQDRDAALVGVIENYDPVFGDSDRFRSPATAIRKRTRDFTRALRNRPYRS
jgi:hypothetical protein